MMRLLTAVLLVILAGPAAAGLVDHVDPRIGTGAHGHTYPGPTLPFGMVQVGPDTRLTGWDGCSAYHDSDRAVFGFSHTHLSGTGVGDYGDILLMPITGEPTEISGYPDRVAEGWGSSFDKASERTEAGYYAVHLADYGIDVELTATPRTGLHRYVFPAGVDAHVIIDLKHRDRLLDSGLERSSDSSITGFRRSTAWAKDQVVYFRAAFSRPFTRTDLDDTRAILSFGREGGEVLVQVGISAVDVGGASRNLSAEWATFDFETTRRKARDAWSAVLDRFETEGADDEQKTVFATALYHSFLAPNLFSDVDGRYRGTDLEIHRALNRDHYTVFSLWDTYRATHPLFTLVERERTRQFVQTFIAQYSQSGRLPVWELAANETDCMIGYHSVSVIADAYLKGLCGFDEETQLDAPVRHTYRFSGAKLNAYFRGDSIPDQPLENPAAIDYTPDVALDAMIHSATLDHFGLEAYKRDGFIASDMESESVSKTLEYAYDDACIARMAAALGRDDVAAEFDRRSQAWRHLFDPASRCFRPRRNGQWLTPYDPRRVDNHHTEANGWQYRFYAPHHAPEHIAAYGGDDDFAAALDSLFTIDSATTGRTQSDITGLIGQYAHGNEPSHHTAWLYHFVGQPQKSADMVTRILRDFYTVRPDGLIGNEDCGQMSSWYVLSAYGLYDVAPTSRQWLIIPPLFERMSLEFEDGHRFTTRRMGEGKVEWVTFNGKPLERSYLTHDEVIGGGELVWKLGEDGDWGRAPKDRPGTLAPEVEVLAAPWAVATSDRFRDHLDVTLAAADPDAVIHWETDTSDPRRYDGPIRFEGTTTVRFRASLGELTSPTVTARFDAITKPWGVQVLSTPNPQYTAGGDDALVDSRRGLLDWRRGFWQGYQDQDFVVVLDLEAPTPVRRAGAGFGSEARQAGPARTLLPTRMEFCRPTVRVGHR